MLPKQLQSETADEGCIFIYLFFLQKNADNFK